MSENWTTTLPTVSGWYWHRGQGYRPKVLFIDEHRLVHERWGQPLLIDFYEGDEWSGPLEPPPREDAR